MGRACGFRFALSNGVLTEPLIVILQLCRARVTDDGEIRISSSYTATSVLFNYECPELFAFKDRVVGRNFKKFWVVGEISDIQGIEPLEVIPSSNSEVIILDESTPDQQSLKRTNMDCSSSSKT
nr:replication protein A 70 kDa DNA-binding subunit B-like [Ipomoea batatas]